MKKFLNLFKNKKDGSDDEEFKGGDNSPKLTSSAIEFPEPTSNGHDSTKDKESSSDD